MWLLPKELKAPDLEKSQLGHTTERPAYNNNGLYIILLLLHDVPVAGDQLSQQRQDIDKQTGCHA